MATFPAGRAALQAAANTKRITIPVSMTVAANAYSAAVVDPTTGLQGEVSLNVTAGAENSANSLSGVALGNTVSTTLINVHVRDPLAKQVRSARVVCRALGGCAGTTVGAMFGACADVSGGTANTVGFAGSPSADAGGFAVAITLGAAITNAGSGTFKFDVELEYV